MKLSPAWLREFVDAKVDDRRMAHDLTSVGIAVESISGEGKNAVFEMEIGTNRPDAMNHYGVAREASVVYNLPLRPIDSKLSATTGKPDFVVEIAVRAFDRCHGARAERERPLRLDVHDAADTAFDLRCGRRFDHLDRGDHLGGQQIEVGFAAGAALEAAAARGIP